MSRMNQFDNTVDIQVLEQTDLVQREEGPQIADDSETIEPVKVSEKTIKAFGTKKKLIEYIQSVLGDERNVSIKSNGEIVLLSNAGIKRAVSKGHKKEYFAVLQEIKQILQKAHYSGFRKSDIRHPNVKGQDIYHSALVIDNIPYSVAIYVDVSTRADNPNVFAGQKITEIEIEPAARPFKRLDTGSITTISLGVLRQKVKPARYNEGVLYQSAYAGSRVDYDRPSLEAIGTGEGAQAHGWGLYYALDPQIAEKYRETFIADEKRGSNNYFYNGKPMPETKYKDIDGLTLKHLTDTGKNATERWITARIKDIEDLLSTAKRSEHSEEWFLEGNADIQAYKKTLSLLEDMNVDLLKYIEPKGQVHEVDIPEMDVLLDEQKLLKDQPAFVKEKLKEVLADPVFDKYHEDGVDFVQQEITDWELGFSGGNIYDRISNLVGNDKEASQLLEKHGIKGITYDGQQDGRCFVIFNDKDVKVLRKKFDQLGNQLFQRTQANGYYDAELKVIVLGRNMNTMTLPHEMAHFWLDNTFSMFKKASKGELTIGQQWIDETNTLFGILGIDPQQETLTRSQQETFATMTEAVITGLAPVPDGATLPMTEYLNWIPEKYKSIAQIGFRNENGMIVHPVLDQSAVDFFNVWYGNMTLPPIPSSPARDSMTNPRDENGEIIPSTTETMQEREKTISKAIKDQVNIMHSLKGAFVQILCKLCAKTRFFVLFYSTNWYFRQLGQNKKPQISADFLVGTQGLEPWTQ